MSKSRTARAHINRLAAASKNKPSYYFVHGFFVGLSINPNMILPSIWMPILFNGFNLDDDSQFNDMDGAMWLFNEVMQQALDYSIKLPVQCKLSLTKFEASLQAEKPLPQWCEGCVAALDLIDEQALNAMQKDVLAVGKELFLSFTDYQQLEEHLSIVEGPWEQIAVEIRNNFEAQIDYMLARLRFGVEDDEDVDSLLPDELSDFEAEEFDEMFEFALNDDSDEAQQLVEDMIVSYEAVVGADFFKQNRGHFWLISNTRPYMMLKYRRAQLKFAHGDLADAISEFQDLISLNPEDNQNVRSILASMLIMAADWSRLSQLLNEYNEDEGLALEASRALMLYANEGDSEAARVAKKRMHSANKHAVKYLTGQTKSKGLPEMYSLGQASEAEVYLGDFGKEAWRSVAGALFWLRRK